MAQITVMVLLNHLKQLLASSQVNNHQLPPGLEDQVQWLCSKFEIMLKFLMDFEDDNCHRDAVRQLIDGISDLAHASEDVVDKYVHDVVKHKKNGTEPFVLDKDHTMELDNLREMIDRIINRIGYIDGNRCEYGVICKKAMVVPKQQCLSWPTKAWVAEENVTVGLTEDCKRLVDRLINGHAEGSRSVEPEVIAIVGKGGTGKTTLAHKIYENVLVKKHFEPRGWMLVSQKYTLRKLLLSILSDIMVITDQIHGMEEWEMKRLLFNQLSGRRYLIVMDDVWCLGLWDELKDAFPTNKARLGSRIIVTTRSSYVIDSLPIYGPKFLLGFKGEGAGYPSQNKHRFVLQPLGEEKSWKLFSKKIFGKERCPENLEGLGRIIAESCRGSPLVIVTVACILRASEMTVFRWSNIISRITGKRSRSYSDVSSDILTVCYTDMPQHLKACFLYLGVFREDTEIYVKQLIQLWIAEGLIPVEEKTNRSMEDVAEDYLEGLIGRNLIKVTKRRSDGGAKSCRIHDILRDLCINLSEKERFLKVHTGMPIHSIKIGPRRLSILSGGENYISISNTFSSSRVLRSFSCFSQDLQRILEKNWESLFKWCPLIRVLNLGEGEVGKLSEAIAELFHLRYLRVRPAKKIRVPKSIFNHWNLQTIDLRTIRFPELPKEIWKMQQLRHLYLDGPSRLPETESEECLPNLHTLSYISNDPNDDICISKKVPNLRKLGLYDYHCFSNSEQDVTFNLLHLQSLKFAEECTFEGLEEPIKLPTTLTKITVRKAHLQPNVIKMFEVLPNIQILKFVQTSFDDDELVFGENSFPKLKLLKFEDSNVVTWRLEKGASPNLHSLVISKCHRLTELPAELREVNKLKKVDFFWASPTLAKKLESLTENKGLKLVIHSKSSA